jgi:hypothetical protein
MTLPHDLQLRIVRATDALEKQAFDVLARSPVARLGALRLPGAQTGWKPARPRNA